MQFKGSSAAMSGPYQPASGYAGGDEGVMHSSADSPPADFGLDFRISRHAKVASPSLEDALGAPKHVSNGWHDS